uniref:Uncharacterized protein n=1 Tax=Utricularia reniformis TaxID=192314 RepID=A0A1Y0B0T6_9LAMI|nr:hypothetical protein AEK19_MT0738 [Utricularia reniformis]ART30981.1 hypothetical protein AEK19_MT0738 [Utricularia reniformis]
MFEVLSVFFYRGLPVVQALWKSMFERLLLGKIPLALKISFA